MRQRVFAAAVGLLMLTGAGGALATTLPDCCACLAMHNAMTSGAGPALTPAIFCAEAERGNTMELQERCDARSGSLFCVANIPGPSCAAQLAGEGYGCPRAGAPAASPLNLAALTAVLAVLGAVAVQRHRRRLSLEDRP